MIFRPFKGKQINISNTVYHGCSRFQWTLAVIPWWLPVTGIIFSSPEQKPSVSFSDLLLSVFLYVCKLTQCPLSPCHTWPDWTSECETDKNFCYTVMFVNIRFMSVLCSEHSFTCAVMCDLSVSIRWKVLCMHKNWNGW